jgi:uncharacterized protein VirK/YbjX
MFIVGDRVHKMTTLIGEDLRHEPAPHFTSAISLPDPTIPCQFTGAQLTAEPKAGSPGSVLLFARDRYYLSPARIFRFLWGVSTDIPRQLEIFRLMRIPAYADFLLADPRFRFKFLIRNYLVRGLSTAQRTACFLHHYKRLHASMSSDLLHRTLYQSVTVLDAQRGNIHIEISLCFSRPFEKEGELSLNLHVDGAVVFVLSFTIIPGWVVQSEAEEVLLISRLQGTNGYYPEIRAATKIMQNVGPAALLLAALHGIAKAFGISWMAAVSCTCQSSYTEELSLSYRNAYDDFFSEIGVAKNAAGFFLSTIPPEVRPMSSIKQGHKIRTREKRQLKRQIAEDVYFHLRPHLRGKDSEPAFEEESQIATILNP